MINNNKMKWDLVKFSLLSSSKEGNIERIYQWVETVSQATCNLDSTTWLEVKSFKNPINNNNNNNPSLFNLYILKQEEITSIAIKNIIITINNNNNNRSKI